MNLRIITKNHAANREIRFVNRARFRYAVKFKRYESLILSEFDKLLIIILEMTVAVLSM